MSTVFIWRDSDKVSQSAFAMSCPACECELTLHQPDPELPGRLLATCDECKSWFLANFEGIVMPVAELPDDAIRCRPTA